MMEEKKKGLSDQLDAAFENPREEKYVLRLYVTGITPNSRRAIQNLRAFCDEHLTDQVELEIIDIYKRPDLAREAQIIATPTLVKEVPAPLKRFIGDLSDEEQILAGFDLVYRND